MGEHQDHVDEPVGHALKATPQQEYAQREISKVRNLLRGGTQWCDVADDMTGVVKQMLGEDTPERQQLLKCLEEAAQSYKLINDRLDALRRSNADAADELHLVQ